MRLKRALQGPGWRRHPCRSGCSDRSTWRPVTSARPVPGLRRKAVLAALALHAGDVVSTDRLIDIVWGGGRRAPASTRCSATSPTSAACWATRRRSSPSPRATGSTSAPSPRTSWSRSGWSSRPGSATTRRGARPATARRSACGVGRRWPTWPVWTGSASTRTGWSGCGWSRWRGCSTPGWRWASSAGLVPELEALARQHPFQESVHRQLMLALYRSGRQQEALAAYQRLRNLLDEELGISPSAPLRELQAAILRQAPELDPPPPATSLRRAGPAPRPARRCRRSCRSRSRLRRAGGRARPARRRPRRATGAGLLPLAVGGDLGGVRHAGRGQDHPRRALGPPGRRAVPGRPALREPARVRPERSAARPERGAGRLPGRVRGDLRPDPGRPRRPGRAVPQRAGRLGGCWSCWTTPGTPSRSARCCPVRRLPGRRHQPEPAHHPGRRTRRPAAGPGPADGAGVARPVREADRGRPGGRRTGGDPGHPRPVRAAAAGDRRRGGQRGLRSRTAARDAGGAAARGGRHPARPCRAGTRPRTCETCSPGRTGC